jgi:hypothetical protein
MTDLPPSSLTIGERWRLLLELLRSAGAVIVGGRTPELARTLLALTAGSPSSRGAEVLMDVAALGLRFSGTGTVLSRVRDFPTSTRLENGMILVAGGRDSSGVTASAELYDPAADRFVPTGSMSTPRVFHTATNYWGTVLVAGGENAAGNVVDTAEVYDPTTGQFQPVSTPMRAARKSHAATATWDGRILLTGGFGADDLPLSIAELYYAAQQVFDVNPASAFGLAIPRAQHTSTRVAYQWIYIVGGIDANGNPLGSIERYDTDANQMATRAIRLSEARYDHATVAFYGVNRGADLLVAGGTGTGGALGTAEHLSYMETSQPVARTYSMSAARSGAAAVRLPNDEVLVLGGEGPAGVLASTEIFSLARGGFRSGPPMTIPRIGHAAALLRGLQNIDMQ